VTEGMKRHNEFTEALMHELARLWREGERRIDRTHVEEIGERYDVDPDEAGRAFVDSRGTLWEGELVEGDGESDWRAAELDNVPSAGTSTDSSV
jgi:hypothetical protein